MLYPQASTRHSPTALPTLPLSPPAGRFVLQDPPDLPWKH